MSNIFVLLTAYYILKPVREALILSSGGAEIKSYAGAAQALLFIAIVPLYGAFANRVNRLHLINGVTAFFISNLVIFYVLARMQVNVAIPFFLWVGLFSLMLVAQVWALANDIYHEEQGKRLFAIVGIGASLGAIFGAYIAGVIFEPLGPYRMMLLSGALLFICMGLTTWVHRRETRGETQDAAERAPVAARTQGAGGFQLVFKHRYLLLIAIMVLLTNFVNTTGEFILGKAVELDAQTAVAADPGMTEEQYIGTFYANFFFWVNVLGAFLQLFIVSRLLKYVGIGTARLFLPIIALGSYSLLAFFPILSLVRSLKIVENGTDYSLHKTAQQALFLRTDRDAKFKAKTAIDNFFWRLGDAGSAVLVFAGTQLAFGLTGFATANIIGVVVWLGIVIAIIRIRNRQADEPIVDRPAAA